MCPVMLLRAVGSMMLLRAPAVVAMAMLTSPGFHALRLHSTAKTTCRSLPHKSIPSFAREQTASTYMRCNATTLNVICVVGIRYRSGSTIQASSERRGVAATCAFDITLRSKPIHSEGLSLPSPPLLAVRQKIGSAKRRFSMVIKDVKNGRRHA